jgi:hypothetical protein
MLYRRFCSFAHPWCRAQGALWLHWGRPCRKPCEKGTSRLQGPEPQGTGRRTQGGTPGTRGTKAAGEERRARRWLPARGRLTPRRLPGPYASASPEAPGASGLRDTPATHMAMARATESMGGVRTSSALQAARVTGGARSKARSDFFAPPSGSLPRPRFEARSPRISRHEGRRPNPGRMTGDARSHGRRNKNTGITTRQRTQTVGYRRGMK